MFLIIFQNKNVLLHFNDCSLTQKGKSFILPKHAQKGDIVYELELGVMLKKGGRNIKRPDYKNHIGAYFLCIDYSDLTLAKEAMAKGQPYFLAKA